MSPLVGRDAELAALRDWLAARVADGSGPALWLVGGEAGVGKTAVLDAAVATLDPRTPVVRAAGRPWGDRPLLAGDARRAVYVLDDLHWADESSLEALLPLLDDAFAVLGAYRAEELPRGHLLRQLRAQARQRRTLGETTLGPLGGDDLTALITAVAGDPPTPDLVEAVERRTEGLPFYVEELISALAATGRLLRDDGRVGLASDDLPLPESIRDAVALRCAALPQRDRDALEAAAVVGPDIDVDVVAALTGAPWPDTLDECGLFVAPAAATRRFRHALVEEAVHADLPWSRRRALHLAAADHLAARPGTEIAVARHLVAAHEPTRARPALLAAAEVHLARHAVRDAARLFALALETWPTGEDEEARLAAVDRHAHCAELCGDPATAVRELRELAARASTPQRLRRLAVAHEQLGQWPLALAAREAAAEAFTRAGASAEAAVEQLAIAVHLRSAASFTAALDAATAAGELADTAGRADLRWRAAGLRGNLLARAGNSADGVPAVHEALERALAAGLTEAAADIYQRLADTLEHAGDYRGATEAYEHAYEFCRTHELEGTGYLCRACATVVLFHAGDWTRALAVCEEVLASDASPAQARTVAGVVSGLIGAFRGNATTARAALLDARAAAVHIELVPAELLATWGLAVLDESAGHLASAAASYRHVLARVRETDERHYCVPILHFAAARFAADGARQDLGAVAELLADAAARTGQPEARAAFTHALGEADVLEQRSPARLRAALDQIAGLGLPVVETLVRRRLALVAGDPEEAATLLRAAHRAGTRLRATALLRPIAGDLEALGLTVTARRDTTGLSPRETEVLRLVGEGLTNREIARRLFLSVRTVEMHVRNAMAALDCRTRAEAVRRLSSLVP